MGSEASAKDKGAFLAPLCAKRRDLFRLENPHHIEVIILEGNGKSHKVESTHSSLCFHTVNRNLRIASGL